MKFILVIVMTGYGYATSSTGAFDSEQACRNAAAWVEKISKANANCFPSK